MHLDDPDDEAGLTPRQAEVAALLAELKVMVDDDPDALPPGFERELPPVITARAEHHGKRRALRSFFDLGAAMHNEMLHGDCLSEHPADDMVKLVWTWVGQIADAISRLEVTRHDEADDVSLWERVRLTNEVWRAWLELKGFMYESVELGADSHLLQGLAKDPDEIELVGFALHKGLWIIEQQRQQLHDLARWRDAPEDEVSTEELVTDMERHVQEIRRRMFPGSGPA